MKWWQYIVYGCLMQISFYDTLTHFYGRTHNHAMKTQVTFSQMHYNVINIWNSGVCHYSIISTLHMVLWLLIYESIWNLTFRLFNVLRTHYTCDKCCNSIIYVKLPHIYYRKACFYWQHNHSDLLFELIHKMLSPTRHLV